MRARGSATWPGLGLVRVLGAVALAVLASCSGGGDATLEQPPAATAAPAPTATAAPTPVPTVAPTPTATPESLLLADDDIHGSGAERYEVAVRFPPGAADETLEPIRIGVLTHRIDALGAFPEFRSGFLAGLEEINERFGGVEGRPVEVAWCEPTFDPGRAARCAEDLAAEEPEMVVVGFNFFVERTLTPLTDAGIPIVLSWPLLELDFGWPGAVAISGGCPTLHAGVAALATDALGLDRVAVVYSNTPIGTACIEDVLEPVWTAVGTQHDMEARFIPNDEGDPSDEPGIVGQLAAAVDDGGRVGLVIDSNGWFECLVLLEALPDDLRAEAVVIAPRGCADGEAAGSPALDDVLFVGEQRSLGSTADGLGFESWEVDHRDTVLGRLVEERLIREVGGRSRRGYVAAIFVWQVLTDAVLAGEDVTDAGALMARLEALTSVHVVGQAPVSCSDNGGRWPAICPKTVEVARWDGSSWQPPPDGVPDRIDVREINELVSGG